MGLVEEIATYSPSLDLQKITNVWEYCKLVHHGQKRLSGDPYISHLLETAKILSEWKLDTDTIFAGLLHDSIDDGGVTSSEIHELFGNQIGLLVDGITSVSSIGLIETNNINTIENLRKLVLVLAKDLRVVFIKLADRLHNMRTLEYLPDEDIKRVAKETLEIYVPLSEQIGMGGVKAELSEIAFKYLYPKRYKEIDTLSHKEFKLAEKIIDNIKKTILVDLALENINAEIYGRKKSLYSVWKKLERPGIDWDFTKLHDIIAMRVVVENEEDCYVVLSIIQEHYKIKNDIISDYISSPKSNGYQSIHIKIIGPHDKIVEVQIRTHAMHEQAEYGMAAHWFYSQAKEKGASDEVLESGVSTADNKLSWVKKLVQWQSEVIESDAYMRAVKFDLFDNRIFVYTPKGDLYDLPKGATPIDFACNVHTKLCRYIKSAKVNGKMVGLDYKLRTGDVVEIVKSTKERLPGKNWLNMVETEIARKEINKYIRN